MSREGAGGPLRLALLADASVVHSLRWAEALGERGFAVRLFSLEIYRAAGTGAALDTRRLPAAQLPGFLRYPLALPALRRALADFKPDLVDAHFLPNYGLLGAMSGARPLVVNSWGSDLLLARGPWRRARVRWVMRRADRIVVDAAVSERAALELGAPRERLWRQPWGVDRAAYPFGGAAAERRSRRAGWPAAWRGAADEAALVVVSTRHLHKVYDMATLIAAWPVIRARHPGARLVLAGEGPERPRLVAQAAALGVAEAVCFAGRLDAGSLASLLAGADLYASTSLSDTTSISLLEAMSAGALPVVSELEANTEWLSAERAEFFAPGDAAGLARAVDRLTARSAEWESMRQANAAVVRDAGDRGRAMDRVAAFYRDLVEERRRAARGLARGGREAGFTAR